jgi:outer membrane lipase/esterase
MNRRILAILVTGVLGTSTVSAASFTSLTIFGDSLTDTGNVFLATGGAVPTAPYFNGRFSNGPVWVETLAAQLGFPGASTAALAGGNNYAFGGARTGAEGAPVPGLLAQSGGLWGPANPVADPTGLFVLVGGGNDMRDARSAFTTDSPADQAGRQAAAQAAVINLANNLGFLASRGAKNVLIGNLPDLGATPEAVGLGLVAPSADASARFNALMPFLLETGTNLGLEMFFFDLAGVAAAVRDDALNNGGAVYGITNVFTPCGAFQGSIGISCDISLFSDALHPTARAHELAGLAAFAALMPDTAVAEPGTLALLAIGLLLLSVSVPGVRVRVRSWLVPESRFDRPATHA